MELTIIKFIFASMTFLMILMSALINTLEKYLPAFFVRGIRYGKFSLKGKDAEFMKLVEVPKAWFKHYYIFASILSVIILYFVFGTYVLNVPVPLSLRKLVDYLGNESKNRETAAATLLATILFTMQCLRRLYDTHFVSIFGTRSRMNLSHYMVGFIHYFAAFFAILVEAPNFTLLTNKIYYFRLQDLYFKDFLAVLLFLLAWYKQFETTVILANLRKNIQGRVVADGYYMPEGGWFKYVSSPHLMTEVMMYISLSVILWNNITFKYVLLWVMSNQFETALLSHWWYKDTFPKYPSERKAIIPFIF